ncbi:MAG TPA: hypothetical protein VGF92_08780, partial [Stellaceae bacterium]
MRTTGSVAGLNSFRRTSPFSKTTWPAAIGVKAPNDFDITFNSASAFTDFFGETKSTGCFGVFAKTNERFLPGLPSFGSVCLMRFTKILAALVPCSMSCSRQMGVRLLDNLLLLGQV